MRRLTSFAALVFLAVLPACKQEVACTPETLDQMTTDLMIKVQAFGAANPDKMTGIGPRVADVVAQAQGATDDLRPICDAVQALIDEVSG